MPPVTIPANLRGGRYYVGVLLDLIDVNQRNNTTIGWDCAELSVTARPVYRVYLPAVRQTR